jgi:hypothetical protein
MTESNVTNFLSTISAFSLKDLGSLVLLFFSCAASVIGFLAVDAAH